MYTTAMIQMMSRLMSVGCSDDESPQPTRGTGTGELGGAGGGQLSPTHSELELETPRTTQRSIVSVSHIPR